MTTHKILLDRLSALMPEDSPNPFWDYSLRLYSQPSVAQSCLELQQEHNADVNIILFLLWLGEERRLRVDPETVKYCLNQTAAIRQQVITPLRTARKFLPKESGPQNNRALRTEIQLLELWAERIEQDLLFHISDHLVTSFPDHIADYPKENLHNTAIENLGVYADLLS
ncbi:MAG: TIGR02444 family protein [Kordiimonas sp.]|nr:TIGR02444 family protein [Kordiimonas sp.]